MKRREIYIKLTTKDTGRSAYINPDLIVGLDPLNDGCLVRTVSYILTVDEKHTTILDMIEDIKKGETNG